MVWLEEDNMEDIMNLHFEEEAGDDRPLGMFHHLVGVVVAWGELGADHVSDAGSHTPTGRIPRSGPSMVAQRGGGDMVEE